MNLNLLYLMLVSYRGRYWNVSPKQKSVFTQFSMNYSQTGKSFTVSETWTDLGPKT